MSVYRCFFFLQDENENEDGSSENGGEVDEAFRTEIKLALGSAALVSDEVACH